MKMFASLKATTIVLAFILLNFSAQAKSSITSYSIKINVTEPKTLALDIFKGEFYANGVILNWTIAQNTAIDYYEVECSYDNVNFSTVGLVLDALTINNNEMTYAFKDNSKQIKSKKIAYYRLKAIDKQGIVTYSSPIKVSK